MQGRKIDIAILGGGLAGGLIALAFARLRPELSLLLIERDAHFGGNHLWSFFASDIAETDEWLVEPLILRRWESYEVRFPRYVRKLTTPYRSTSSEKLDAALRAALPAEALLAGAEVAAATPTSVTLSDGTEITAGGVIDARGAAGMAHMAGGWQKFVGQMVRLKAPHSLSRPVVMDARVTQRDGFRFVYCLPFSEREIFVEDTYYADGPELDVPLLRQRIDEYVRAQRWEVAEVLREEVGVLPVVARGDFAKFWAAGESGVARAGARAGLLHPLTSYSLPIAACFALHLAGLPDVSGEALAKASYDAARHHWRRGGFYRMLSTMMFGATSQKGRYRVLDRFYKLPQDLIERFYAGHSTFGDRVRVLTGKAPVRITRALASLIGRGNPLAPLDKSS